jgi:hypothetical protein
MKTKKQESETFKTILPKIVKFLNESPDGRKLWDVLTALRGPDHLDRPDSDQIKDSTTAVIRYAIGLNGSVGKDDSDQFSFTISTDSEKAAAFRRSANEKSTPLSSYHFFSHAHGAFDALGLNWESVNSISRKQK